MKVGTDIPSCAQVLQSLTKEDLHQLAVNVVTMFEHMHKSKQLECRKDFICCLANNLSAEAAAKVTYCDTSTVYKARSAAKVCYSQGYWLKANKHYLIALLGKVKGRSFLDMKVFISKALSGDSRKKRERTASETARRGDAIGYMRAEFAVCKSGDKTEIFRSTFTRAGSFKRYQLAGGTAGATIFHGTWDELGVRKAKHAKNDFFSCALCQPNGKYVLQLTARVALLREQFDGAGDGTPLKRTLSLQVQTTLAEIASIEVSSCSFKLKLQKNAHNLMVKAHISVHKTQREAYQRMRERLGPSELMLTLDFGVHQVQAGAGQGQLPDLVIVAHYKNEDGELEHVFLDCIPLVDQAEVKDFNYVISALTDLYLSGFFHGYSRIIWWSDTGPAHFRTSNTLFELRRLQDVMGIEFCVHFFAPRHGHSQADGHLGVASKSLRSGAQDLHNTLQLWDREWVIDRLAALTSTLVYFTNIKRKEKTVSTLVGMQRASVR